MQFRREQNTTKLELLMFVITHRHIVKRQGTIDPKLNPSREQDP